MKIVWIALALLNPDLGAAYPTYLLRTGPDAVFSTQAACEIALTKWRYDEPEIGSSFGRPGIPVSMLSRHCYRYTIKN